MFRGRCVVEQCNCNIQLDHRITPILYCLYVTGLVPVKRFQRTVFKPNEYCEKILYLLEKIKLNMNLKKRKDKPTKTTEKPIKLDMDFNEAIKRLARVKPQELKQKK